VPLWLALGVGFVESKFDPGLKGRHSVVGLMQVMPSTARFQGYRGSNEGLLDPETNIVWGMKELGWDYAAAKGDPCLAIAKYKGGIATKRISSAAADYCRRAKLVTGMI
jgi:soluble lytic murein transglycosylase-like protein